MHRFFETILTVLLLLLLGYVFETRIKAGCLVGGLAGPFVRIVPSTNIPD